MALNDKNSFKAIKIQGKKKIFFRTLISILN